jgi:hypothetical protein
LISFENFRIITINILCVDALIRGAVFDSDDGWVLVLRFAFIRIISNLAGLGIKPNGASTLTNRPIHHSLLNF